MREGMDRGALGFDWNRARAFLAVAEEGSFSAAARSMGSAQPTVGRQVASLEAELGITLFERIGNQLQLTAAGLDLLEHVRGMAEAANRFSLTAAGQALSVEGLVTLSASELVAAYFLPPALTRLRALYPALQVEVVASNQATDIARREADIALRNFRPSQADLRCRKLGESVARFYASPHYLARWDHPLTRADLPEVELFAFERSDFMIRHFANMGVQTTQANFPITCGHHLVQWAMAKQGLGVCMVMEEVGDADPTVVRVLEDLPAIPIPMWLVTHRELDTSRRIRAVFDVLVETLGPTGSHGASERIEIERDDPR